MAIHIDRIELADLANPKALAAAVTKQVGDVFPVPIEEIAFACGITEIKPLTSKGFEGALLTTDAKAQGIILVNQHNAPTRRRFTVGHELGHFLNPWHVPPAEGFMCSARDMLHSDSRQQKNRQGMEAEANEFAAAILMPAPLFLKDYRRVGGSPTTQIVKQVADNFSVSTLAAARRLVDLREESALVLSCNGVIEQIYRGPSFPFISRLVGQPVPSDSITKTFNATPQSHSEIEETDPATWTSATTKRGLQFLEQVLIQSNGYRLTLLVLDESECEDEEDEWVRERSERRPSFR